MNADAHLSNICFDYMILKVTTDLTLFIFYIQFFFVEAFRAPFFTSGQDKNGFSLGFSRNAAEVFGDQAKYWMVPVYSR